MGFPKQKARSNYIVSIQKMRRRGMKQENRVDGCEGLHHGTQKILGGGRLRSIMAHEDQLPVPQRIASTTVVATGYLVLLVCHSPPHSCPSGKTEPVDPLDSADAITRNPNSASNQALRYLESVVSKPPSCVAKTLQSSPRPWNSSRFVCQVHVGICAGGYSEERCVVSLWSQSLH